MKKIILYILLFFLTYSYSYSNYGNVTVNSLGSPETNCSVSVNSRYYLGTKTYLLDLLGHSGGSNSNDWFIGFSSTNVGVFNPNNNIRINGGFQFTSRILPSNESSVVAMFNLSGTDIIGHPANRNDLAAQVVYNVSIAPKISGTRSGNLGYSTYYSSNWVNSSKTIDNYNVDTNSIHTEKECYNMYVSWCGDGVLDSSYGETCDPSDPNKIGWGAGGCNSSCQPINTTAPSCTSLTATPTTGVNSLTSTMTCTGANASTYTINCGNGQTINSNTGTCNYTSVGTYTPTCFVNGTITSPTCQQTVSVTPSTAPSCTSLTATPTTGVNSLTSTMTCTGANASTYTINCGNGQTINSNTGTCNYTSVGTYTPTCFVNGTITSPTCQQTVSVTPSTAPSCTSLTATPTTGVNSLTSTMTCTGANASTYTINCGNGQTINSNTGTCNYTSVGTYTPTCFVNGTITSPTCQQTVSVNNSSSSSSSGGSTYQCRDISMTGNQITCTGNHLVQTFRLSCNGSFLFAPAVLGSSNTTSATFTCNDNRATCSVYNQPVTESSFYSWATNPACTLTPSSSSSSGGSTSSSSSSGGSTSSSSSSGGSSPDYCGDGVVQRPNQNLQTEECDFGTGVWPAWCSKTTCKIDGIVTYPNDGEIVFGPKDNLIIGNNMNPYVAYSLDKPSIYNNSPYDLYFDSLCVVKKSGTTINGNIDCRPLGTALGRGLFPGEKFSFSTYPNFIGDTSTLPSGTNFGDNVLVTTIEHESKTYTDAYFASELKVRVSKPSIATTGGGTSYISNTANISNISEVSKDILDSDKNKNFVGAGVSSGNISSYSSDINDTSSVEKISQEGSKYNNAANTTTNITLPSIGTTSNLSDFNNYNGINNAFILKNTSFIVSMNTFSGLNGPRTYIIENGDLIINSNINYSNNIAFVVKGGNIKIDKSVNSINGTYISIPYGSNGGDIMGVNGKTNTILNIKGSIYGNLDKLVSQRDYVKENSGLLSVGTIVSFGSSVFRDPAPLTSTFINEYMEATKVAK